MNENKIAENKTIFLIGAGFSKCAGLPLNNDLPELITNAALLSCQSNTYLQLRPDMSPREAASDKNYHYNIPALYLTQIALKHGDKNFDKFLQYCTEFPAALSDDWNNALKYVNELRIRDVVDEAIKAVLERPPTRIDYIDNLVKYCNETGSPIYSTNFDTLIEQACVRLGYEPDVAATFSRLTKLPKANFRLHKINGSLDWDYLPKVEDVPLSDYPVRFERSIQTMGMQKIALSAKDKLSTMASALPSLFELHEDFRRYKKVIAIGTSFQDPQINSVIYSSLHNKGYMIDVVTPDFDLPPNIILMAENINKDNNSGNINHIREYASTYCNQKFI